MSPRKVLEPSVEFRSLSEHDFAVYPPRPKEALFEAMGWLGEPLLATSPCSFVTRPLAEDLGTLGATGSTLNEIVLEIDDQFLEFQPDTVRAMPDFVEIRPVM